MGPPRTGMAVGLGTGGEYGSAASAAIRYFIFRDGIPVGFNVLEFSNLFNFIINPCESFFDSKVGVLNQTTYIVIL